MGSTHSVIQPCYVSSRRDRTVRSTEASPIKTILTVPVLRVTGVTFTTATDRERRPSGKPSGVGDATDDLFNTYFDAQLKDLKDISIPIRSKESINLNFKIESKRIQHEFNCDLLEGLGKCDDERVCCIS